MHQSHELANGYFSARLLPKKYYRLNRERRRREQKNFHFRRSICGYYTDFLAELNSLAKLLLLFYVEKNNALIARAHEGLLFGAPPSQKKYRRPRECRRRERKIFAVSKIHLSILHRYFGRIKFPAQLFPFLRRRTTNAPIARTHEWLLFGAPPSQSIMD